MDARTPALDPCRRLAWLGLLLCGPVSGQALPIDESKLPDWVKRQAAMPYRVIIQSPTTTTTTPSAAPPAAVRRPAATPLAVKKPAAAAGIAPGAATIALDPQDSSEPAVEGAAAIAAQPAPRASPEPEAALAAASPRPAEAASALEVLPALTLIRRVDPKVLDELLATVTGDKQVTVAFTVQPDGEVSDPQVIASTDSQLNRPVLRAIRSWRYAPIPQARRHAVNFAFVAP